MLKFAKDILKSIADYFNIHWIQKTIILFFPTIWFPVIINVWGDKLGLSTKDSLTRRGIIATLLILGAVFLVNILSSYKAKLEKEREVVLQNSLDTMWYNLSICETVMDSIYDICDTKYDTLLEYMDGIVETNKCEKPFLSTVKPTKQLKAISDQLANCFSKITGIRKNEIIVSMAYRTARDSEWKWVDFKDLHGCAKLGDLINDKHSTFYQVYSGKEVFAFYNSKMEAEKLGNYTFDAKDRSHKNKGSIICQKIEIGSEENVQGTIILSISSYGKQFVESNATEKVENVENTIRYIILKQFEKRICIELSDLFIKDLYGKYKVDRGPDIHSASVKVQDKYCIKWPEEKWKYYPQNSNLYNKNGTKERW